MVVVIVVIVIVTFIVFDVFNVVIVVFIDIFAFYSKIVDDMNVKIVSLVVVLGRCPWACIFPFFKAFFGIPHSIYLQNTFLHTASFLTWCSSSPHWP